MLTKAEQDAMKWLESVIASPVDWNGERQHARTIRGMVEARLPPRPVVDCYPNTEGYTMPEWDAVTDAISHYHCALYARLTKPATKPVETYTVRCTSHLDTEFAECGLSLEKVAACIEDNLRKGYHNIRVTGPHKVPA